MDFYYFVLYVFLTYFQINGAYYRITFMLNYHITISFRKFTKALNRFFYLCSTNENLETCMPV